jgi:Ni/Co efflux regulator RcnB
MPEDVQVKRYAARVMCVPLLLFAALALAAPPEGKGRPQKAEHKESGRHAQRESGSDLQGFDEEAWRAFVREQRYAGYDALPPGIRKNLARGKPLPPGIARREVPPELLRGLPHREGYEWRVVGADVVLYSITSGIVDQILRDVFFD